jgi:6-phosphogluconolactonase
MHSVVRIRRPVVTYVVCYREGMRRLTTAIPVLAAAMICGCLGEGGGGDGGGGAGGDGGGGAGGDMAGGGGDLAGADLLPPGPFYVYVSGYSATISRYTLDVNAGTLTARGTTTATGQLSFLAIDAVRRHLYAVDEQNSKVLAFTIDATNGALTHVGTDPGSGGTGPAHLAVDGTGAHVLTANYGSGDVAVLAVQSNGSVGMPTAVSPKPGLNAHQVVLDAAGAHAWVPCLGSDYVAQYGYDAATGKLTVSSSPTVGTPAGSGPRHLALHPNGKWAYLIAEKTSTITAYTIDANGHLTVLQQPTTTRAAGAMVSNTGAEVAVHPSGKFVYASNRGDDDIAVFMVGTDGKVVLVANTKTGGQTPRMFAVDPTGRWLLVGNQGSNEVRVFAINGTTGMLTGGSGVVTVQAPSFVGIVTF